MRIFISHISEEAPMALVLKEWIESSFAGQCDVFVSSDKDDVPAGSKWLDTIDQALEEAVVLMVLCSPASLARPWVNFETGCGWIKRVPVLPICHSGQNKGTLPSPISMFQALEVDDASFVEGLLSSLVKHLGFSKIPRIDQASMSSEILAAAGSIKSVDSMMSERTSSASEKAEIPDECIEILMALGKSSRRGPTAQQLAGHFDMSEQRMQYFLDILDGNNLVYRALFVGSPSTYSLNENGRKYLFERDLL